MKRTWLMVVALWLSALTLAWCNSNCNCENGEKEVDARLQQAMDFCLEHWGTHSLVHSQTAVYGECMFPSGIGCEDDMVLNGECNYEPNLESIDTEEERLAGCEENVQWWMTDFVEGAENVSIEWGEESEGGASFVRNGEIRYTKDGSNWKMDVECVADFVDGSLGTSYGDEELVDEENVEEETVDEETTDEEMTEEVVDEVAE